MVKVKQLGHIVLLVDSLAGVEVKKLTEAEITSSS